MGALLKTELARLEFDLGCRNERDRAYREIWNKAARGEFGKMEPRMATHGVSMGLREAVEYVRAHAGAEATGRTVDTLNRCGDVVNRVLEIEEEFAQDAEPDEDVRARAVAAVEHESGKAGLVLTILWYMHECRDQPLVIYGNAAAAAYLKQRKRFEILVGPALPDQVLLEPGVEATLRLVLPSR